MKKIAFYSLSLMMIAFIMVTSSCRKYLNQTPAFGLNAEVVYGDPNNYINVLAKLYSGLSMTGIQGPAGNGDIAGIDEGFSSYIRVLYNLQELPTDMVVCGWNDPGIPELNRMTWSAETSFIKGMYFRIYYQITLCNEFIRESSEERMTSRNFSEADKIKIRRFREEARFLRALSYYHALDLFGNVPFVTEDDLIGAFQPPRIIRVDLFNYIESELLAIIPNLPTPSPAIYGHATNMAARALLARLYLNAEVYTNTQRYADCAQQCMEIINSNAYSLQQNYQHLFMADNHTSPEVIFPIIFDGLYAQTWGGTTFLTCAAIGGAMVASDYGVNGKWAGLRVTPMFVDMFADSTLDSRYQFFKTGQQKEITSLGSFSHGYALPKFKNIRSTGGPGSNNAATAHVDVDFPMFRLADVYLMYAECAARGHADAGLGLTYINRVRERAYGNSDYNFGSLNLNEILDERARELHWECIRRTDLIRFNLFTSSDYLWTFKGGPAGGQAVGSYRNLFPLPTSDLVLNRNLIQNTGY
jgi:starch-binding outer membrane protein, SusD/RagB family